jgi:hypothetical protein
MLLCLEQQLHQSYNSILFFFYKISSVDLPYQQENICLSLEPGHTLYAVGSQSHVTMLDGRCPSNVLYSVESIDKDAGADIIAKHLGYHGITRQHIHYTCIGLEFMLLKQTEPL